ncbi:CitMHS family transporter [Spelaeicoccus albus]|uniref:CitMHS family citrate-Mg2+:H+ or citrate-Ca2+:H+ symporter n=1 Tax=Spelaeicoccus albus TaxID=1280376 RepID=A0A7Z0AAZ3_9MICO|nr:CitMHS family transporter [Spelaeicoccus albus]NYI66795.1 CitMHS family citrate-Mg2+:H+ or citrate-Ca2+:H+ symporter [Spelaeicoccus albus]
MLVILGFLMIATFMVLIMTKKLTPILALIIVPTAFGLFAGAGFGIGDMVMDSIKDMSSTAALLMFAIVYFGLMINVGLFDPLVRLILRKLGNDPAKIVLGTALLSGAVSLDGDGSTTFIVVTAALLPVYQRLGLSPVVLTCVAGLTNGTLNIVPWGGPTARAAAALKVPASDIFVPLVPSLVAGLVVSLGFAWMLGVRERNRLRAADPIRWSREPAMAGVASSGASVGSVGGASSGGSAGGADPAAGSMADTALDPDRESLRPKLIWFNLALTVAIMVMLVVNVVPLPFVFMVGCAVALVVNFPHIGDQAKQLASHATSVIAVVAMVLAAGVLTGVLSGTGMVDAMSSWLVGIIPDSLGPHMAVITALLSIPMTFFMSNDAFYFGVLPVLSNTAAHFGVAPVEMARASVIGQPVHLQSPLVPAILLLVSLAGVDLGDHHKKVLWRALVVAFVMLAVGIGLAVIPFG